MSARSGRIKDKVTLLIEETGCDRSEAELAAKPPFAMRLTKKRFRQMTDPVFDEAFESGAAIEAEAFAAGEPQQAMQAFFEKRRGSGDD